MSIETAEFTIGVGDHSEEKLIINEFETDAFEEVARLDVSMSPRIWGFAHLLAAAPDLYRELENMVECEFIPSEEKESSRVALAKARGEG